MPRTGARIQAAHANRKAIKGKPGADAGQVHKRFLRWLKVEPEETPEQIAEREAREAAEDREDFLAEFWNGLPASERVRLCFKGGAIYDEIYKYNFQALPTEVIAKRKSTLGI